MPEVVAVDEEGCSSVSCEAGAKVVLLSMGNLGVEVS